MRQGNRIIERIMGCCFKVHRELGPGFNERIYHNALKVLFDQEGLKYRTGTEFELSYLKPLNFILVCQTILEIRVAK